VARALHALSAASPGPFCPVNVAALPEGLIESELFGNMRGAFTGAVADRRGLIEAAAGGTLFLDEASDLSAHVQAKLLRVLEDGEVRRVGAVGARVARFRLIAAIQGDPGALVRSGRWRDDFYYRVTGIVLRVPPLAERRSDIPLLARAYVQGQGLPEIEPEAMAVLERHAWLGNVRELQRALVRATHHSGNGTIPADAVRAALAEAEGELGPGDRHSLADAKYRQAREMVAACGGDTGRAARLLGISRSHLYRLLRHQTH
jgi:transcriptional regulator with PAS, ATPase and Fis domain